jgi:hypothetical protein
MSSSVEIPVEVRSLVATVIARGRFANEQELVSEILKVAVPALEGYDQLRHDVRTSVAMAERGEIRKADFNGIRKQLCDDYDEKGNRQ